MKKLLLITLSAITIILPPDAFGFGKNKVQYQRMEWQILESPHYTLYFHQDLGTLPAMSYMWLDEIYGDLSARFGFVHKRPVPVALYGSPTLFEQTNIITEILPEEVGGFTEIFKNRVAVPFNGSYADLRHVLHHEMVHAFIFGVMLDGGSIFRMAGVNAPLWWSEGLAEFLSIGWDRTADMYMLDRVLNSNVPPPGPLMQGYIAYKGGQSFLHYLHCTSGDSLFNAMLLEFRKNKDADKAIEHVYNAPLDSLGRAWLGELKRIYWPEVGRRMDPSGHAAAITNSAKDRNNLNIRPRISHGGSRIAFFSDKRNYTNIIITDTAGKEMRTIGRHGLGIGESFESFQAQSGAIAWGPNGMELAFAAKRGGKSEIRVVDIQKRGGRTKRAIKLELSAVNGLDWSRDGKTLALTAIANGRSELYTFDLETSKLMRLTNDLRSKSHPRFSPDGKSILFTVVDTANGDTSKTSVGAPLAGALANTGRPSSNIAIYDLEKYEYRLLTDTKWNDKQAAWSPDGKAFAFVSDRNGIDNLYMAQIDAPNVPRALTDYAGSVGNPDWAADGSAIVFDHFANQSWNVRRLTKPQEKLLENEPAKTAWAAHEEDPSIPFFKKAGSLERNVISLSSIITGAAQDSAASVSDKSGEDNESESENGAAVRIDAREDIEFVGFSGDSASHHYERGVVIDIQDEDHYDEYGFLIGAGMSDTTAATDTTETVKADGDADTIAEASADTLQQYNQVQSHAQPLRPHKDFVPALSVPAPGGYKLRFTPDLVIFGLGVSTYSGASGQAMAQFSDIMGDHRIIVVGDMQADLTEYAQIFTAYQYLKLRVDLTVGGFYYKYYSYDGRFRQYYHDLETGGILGASYPFSMFSRIDAQLSASHIERKPLTGVNRTIMTSNTVTGMLGYSYDNILWGITGPLKGLRARARMLISPPIRSIEEQYISADIDMRHYTHVAKRFVWANRVTAGGSLSLEDGSPARRFLLGGSDNWFNYDVNEDNYDQNISYSNYASIVTPLRGWNYFDAVGDRVMLFNSEFRFPFIREIATVWPIPMHIRYINGAIFADAGYAWDRDEQKGSLPIPPKLYGGYGFGMRANLGIFVLRYDRGWPMGNRGGGPINYFSLGAEF